MADPVYPTAEEKLEKLQAEIDRVRYLYEHGSFHALLQQEFFANAAKCVSDEPTYPADPPATPPEEPTP